MTATLVLSLWFAAPAPSQQPVTFASMARAEHSTWAQISQRRSILEADGHGGVHWSAIEEALELGPDVAPGQPRFALSLTGVPGEILDPSELARRRQVHAGRAGFLHQYGSFHLSDPVLADRNYVIVPIDHRSRLGRPTQRVAVIPRQFGRSAWLLEVDDATHFPLYRAEVSSTGVMISTLEVTRFRLTDEATSVGVNWWHPTSPVADFHAAEDAVAALQLDDSAVIPLPSELPAGFQLDVARTVIDTLRPESSLVLIYSDGVESLFVVHTFGAPPPALPESPAAGNQKPYAIFFYQDANTLQLMFYAEQVQSIVIGASGEFAAIALSESLLARTLGR